MGAPRAAGTVPVLVQVPLDQQPLSHPGLFLKCSCRYRQLTADSSPGIASRRLVELCSKR